MTNGKPNISLSGKFWKDHEQLFETLASTVSWDTSMTSRQTASFGEPYNYSQISYPAVPMHSALKPVATALEEMLKIRFNNCLLNYYLSGGNTMGFHTDETSGLQPGTGVAIVSLGSPRDITFRSKADTDRRCSWTLQPGTMLYMDSQIQDDWMHAIKKQADAGPRISLTWRAFALKERGN